ncbi:right-handed parallel beta-helix repeat-containing protein [Bartonella sp. MM55XZML]|uniref:right-handed parallel beta-helix repeat-containing protein n=1 Tax=Bartonella sp. MM55XZML TaxID=3243552 RepID=UPI0035CF5A3C
MSKKFLLSCTAVATIALFSAHTNVKAEKILMNFHGITEEASNFTVGGIIVIKGSGIIGKNLAIIHDSKNMEDDWLSTVRIIEPNSFLDLSESTIKAKEIGVIATDGGIIKMNAVGIIAPTVGLFLEDSKNDKNKLKNVTITSSKDDLMEKGIALYKESKVILENVTVTQAKVGIEALDNSQTTVSGGYFNAKEHGIYAGTGSTITLKNNVTASSDEYGLNANGAQSKITMIGGTVTGKKMH